MIREKFQSTRPVWGATKAAAGDRPRQLISIHAPRVGRDGLHALFVQQGRISIHAPRVGRDAQPGERSWLCADFNPRAPCGARLQLSPLPMYGSGISIHAPRVGRDSGRRLAALRTTTFQSTRPVWGATTRTTGRACRHGQFQSTRPVWGATRAGSLSLSLSTYFNPRAPCGARPERPGIGAMVASDFNPRAPCGARPGDHRRLAPAVYFNPRAPCGARRFYAQSAQKDAQNFNPRAPCGARPVEINFSTYVELFQSTRPVWGATPSARVVDQKCRISIHAPRVGRDMAKAKYTKTTTISIHAPRVGRDERAASRWRLCSYFNPRAPCGARRNYKPMKDRPLNFNPRAPCGARPDVRAGFWRGGGISIHAPRVGRDLY